MDRRGVRIGAALALAAGLGLTAASLAGFASREVPRPHPLQELSYYPSGRYLEPATLGHAETAADLAWLRAVQYYGEHRQTDNRFVRMYHVFDILTTLAPGFVPAYVFGAFALAQEGFDFPRAEQLMLKGLEENPNSGRLAFELGFLYYVRPGARDLRKAAQCFEQAARKPDGPPAAARFAAFARQHSGDLRVAYELWTRVREQSQNRFLRDIAEREMRKIRLALQTGRTELAMRRLTAPRVLLHQGP